MTLFIPRHTESSMVRRDSPQAWRVILNQWSVLLIAAIIQRVSRKSSVQTRTAIMNISGRSGFDGLTTSPASNGIYALLVIGSAEPALSDSKWAHHRRQRLLLFSEHLCEETLLKSPHRQFVFTIPKTCAE
jgi:hypothetical protein